MGKVYEVFPESDLRANVTFLKDSCLSRGLTKC